MISKKSQISFIRNEAESCKKAYDSLRETFGKSNMAILGKELVQRQQYYKAIIKTLRNRKPL